MAWRQFTRDAAKRIVRAAAEVEKMAVGKTPKYPHGRGVPGAAWHFGKLKTALAPGGSAEMDVYYLMGEDWTDQEWDLTVYASPLQTATVGSLDANTWVRVELHVQAGRYYVVNAEC
jgi:hypothetical protein